MRIHHSHGRFGITTKCALIVRPAMRVVDYWRGTTCRDCWRTPSGRRARRQAR